MESKIKFDKNTYKSLINYLYENKDEKYRNFHKKLLNNEEIILIGIRTPILRKIAKFIAKNDYICFIENNSHKTYEETILHGLLLGYIKIDFNALDKLIDDFLPYNNNWAINDIVSSNLKIFKDQDISKIFKYLNSSNPFTIRFGLTLLLSHYINEKNIDKILEICNNIKAEDYYVKMANAWLISICYIKFKEKTFAFLKNNDLDKFTFNKSISKICDSYRVSKEEKEVLKTLRK